MKPELIFELRKMDMTDVHLLEGHLHIAFTCRNMMVKYSIPEFVMREKLELTPDEFEWFIKGAYPYSLKDISKLDTIQYEQEQLLAASRVKKIVDFPEYKDSYPLGENKNEKKPD